MKGECPMSKPPMDEGKWVLLVSFGSTAAIIILVGGAKYLGILV
jgi:hypothetical protein